MTTYRADIDGLRAVAVVAVVLYHAGVRPFSGGFVGVDVFFVISGYLITAIVAEDIRAGRFSLADFYERRVRRLFPALFVVILASSAVASVMFLPEEFRNFGQSAAAAGLFASNILFWIEAGYFDAAARMKPLLHTWSLGVEEQFYLLFPLFLIACRRGRLGWTTALLCVFAASLAFSALAVRDWPDLAFFLLPARLWELLLGGLIAIAPLPRLRSGMLREVAAIGGLGLICWAAVAFSAQTPFPGMAALAPCLGAALVIHAGRDGETIASRFLCLRPVVWIGLVSYSLYLWHWPVLVFAEYYTIRELGPVETSLAIAAAFGLAALSWRYVEQPFRARDGVTARRGLFAGAGAAVAAVVAFGAVVDRSGGVPGRIGDDILALAEEGQYIHDRRDCHFASEKGSPAAYCIRGAAHAPPSFMLLGDSHADMYGPGLFAAARRLGLAGVQFTDSGYVPALGFERAGAREQYRRNHAMLEQLLEMYPDIDVIIVALFWTQSLDYRLVRAEDGAFAAEDGLLRGLDRLVRAHRDRQFIFLEGVPVSTRFGPGGLARAVRFGRDPPWLERAEYDLQRQRYIGYLAQLDVAEAVSIKPVGPLLCSSEICRGSEGGRLLYRDNDHLSHEGALRFEPFFAALLRERIADARDGAGRAVHR